MKIVKRILMGLTGLILTLALFLAYHLYSNVPVTTEEVFGANEAAQTQRAADNFVNVIKSTRTSYAARGAHSKGHACVKAYFRVDNEIDPLLRHGVFAQPGMEFKSWLRFSNGGSNMAKSEDHRNDSRGMAIKLFDMNLGEDNLAGTHSQDFLLHNNPVFFSANAADYNHLVESKNKILSFVDDINPFKWRLRELKHVVDTLAPPPYSPLWDEYFSNTAYKYGPHNIKFSTQPCEKVEKGMNPNQDDPDFLRKTMAAELEKNEACFEFLVQLQDPEKYMPIEDPTIEWKVADSPYIKVASIVIPAQQFDSQQQRQFCENLSFSPWNALPAQKPIGQLNRIRKLVYEASASFRYSSNNSQPPESLDW